MTRFEWAYPSGSEDVKEQWISGSTMILATVIMNAVYLVSETRVKVGEPGINDPGVKVVVTMLTYGMLFGLQVAAYHPLDSHTPAHGDCSSPLVCPSRCSGRVSWTPRSPPPSPTPPSSPTPETRTCRSVGSARRRRVLCWLLCARVATCDCRPRVSPSMFPYIWALSTSVCLSCELSSCRPLHLSRSPGTLGARRPGLHSHLHRLPRLRHLRHG